MTSNRIVFHADASSCSAGHKLAAISGQFSVAATGEHTSVVTSSSRVGRLVRHGVGASLLMAGALLAGCAPNSGPAGSRLRTYAADITGGAKLCEVPAVTKTADGTREAPMKLANDGGWCGIRLHQDGPKPFDAGLLTTRSAHGSVLIHEVGDDTRIDYTPDRGFAGHDAFVVKLIPGNESVHVAVTVTPNG